jgi:hypothetical protein
MYATGKKPVETDLTTTMTWTLTLDSLRDLHRVWKARFIMPTEPRDML